MDKKVDDRPDLAQFKRYQRKFPWSLIFRLMIILASIGIIYYLMQETLNLQQSKTQEEDTPIEIEWIDED